MADVITRFRLETTQFDSKLRTTSKDLAEYTRKAAMAGKDFDRFSQKNLEAARSLGNVASGATNAKDKVKDLVAAYNEVARSYNALTKEQQQTPFGKALAESLQQLKGRIREAKGELQNMSTAGKETGGILEALAGKFGLNVSQLGKVGVALAAVTGAVKLTKDAFFASEENLDEWGRTVSATKDTYTAFLTSLNTGDISGFLTRIDSIVSAARDAYDAIDRLETMKVVNSGPIAEQRAENERFQAMIRTGRYIAPADGRPSTPGLTQGQKLTGEQLKKYEQQLEDGTRRLNELMRKEINATTDAINKMYNEEARRLGMSDAEFKAGTANMDALEQRLAMYEKYRQFEREHTQTVSAKTNSITGVTTQYASVRDQAVNPYEAYKAWGAFKDDSESYQKLMQYMQDRAGLMSQQYQYWQTSYRTGNRLHGRTIRLGDGTATTSSAATEPVGLIATQEALIADLEKQRKAATSEADIQAFTEKIREAQKELDRLNGKVEEVRETVRGFSGLSSDALDAWTKGLKADLSGAEIGSAGFAFLQGQLADATALSNVIKTYVNNGISLADIDTEALWEKLLNGQDIPAETWQQLEGTLNEKLRGLNLDPIKIDVNTGGIQSVKKVKEESKDMSEEWNKAAGAIQSVGSALGSLESPAANVAGIIAQSIATIALTFSKSLVGTVTPWDWIAGAAAGSATMIATIASIKSATAGSYAEGGIIPGSSYNGDRLTANVNSGELILNRAQQGVIASQLTQGRTPAVSDVSISSENIRIILHNAARRRGMSVGEYLAL